MEPDVLEHLEQIRDFRSRYYSKQPNNHEALRRSQRPSKNCPPTYQRTTDTFSVNQENNHVQHTPPHHQGTAGSRNYSNFHGAEEDGDVVMIRSDDVITYSYIN